MKILVVNAGSSSLKYQLIDMKTEEVIAKGNCERVTIDGSFLKHKAKGKETVITENMPNHTVAMKLVLKALTDPEIGVIKSLSEIDAVGHRVVSAGDVFMETTLVTPEVLKKLEGCVDFAPLHVPAAILGVKAIQENLPKVKNVLVFDTSFHATMPEYVFRYALPEETYTQYHIRRYGAHGTSHKFVSEELLKALKMKKKGSKIISCHLGSGSSVTAIKDGKCLDTSMGFTPLEGMVMGTRSGDVDASVLDFWAKKSGMNLSEITTALNKKSGLLGVCGYSDMRDVESHMKENKNCKLALDMLAYRVKKYIGAYTASMNGVDAIVVTAGIGENDALVREKVFTDMEFFGIKFDKKANKEMERGTVAKISAKDSKVSVYVIPTNEEVMIARETLDMVK